MWCTIALVLSLLVFWGSVLNFRATKQNLRDAQRILDDIDNRDDGPRDPIIRGPR